LPVISIIRAPSAADLILPPPAEGSCNEKPAGLRVKAGG
jgi:hypothetical protein